MVRQSIASSTRSTVGKPAPAARGYPIIGCLPQMQRDPLQFLTNMALEYGDVVQLGAMGNQQLFLVTHPDHVKYILHENNQNYIKGDNFRELKLVIGEGLAVAEGSFWRSQRRMMQPIFHRQRIGALVTAITTIITEVLEGLAHRRARRAA